LNKANKLQTARKEGWLTGDSKDTKADDQTIALLKKELGLIRGAARAALGNKPFRSFAPMTFTLTATVTSGVVNTVATGGNVTIAPTNITEQSSWAALFDEVKVHGGTVDFLYANPVNVLAMTNDSRPAVGYDPTDSTAATGVNDVVQLAQHMTLDAPCNQSGNVLSCASNRHRFKFVIPKGDYISSNAAFVGDMWQDFASAQAVGAIKFYHVGAISTAVVCGAGQVMLDMSFRIRE
jgi:hypothetical protein